jgi:hypothetical protein
MVVLRRLDVGTDKITVKFNEILIKVVAYVDFSAPIIQILNISNIDFIYETDQLHNHSQRLFVKAE